MSELRTPEKLEARLREIGAERYHDKHPFHKLLHGGQLGKGHCYVCGPLTRARWNRTLGLGSTIRFYLRREKTPPGMSRA